VAREGWPFLAAAAAVSLLVTYLAGWWSIPFWFATLFILQFFRDPPREVPADPSAVVSPPTAAWSR
jgi:phosphatidylserine decarboxylase